MPRIAGERILRLELELLRAFVVAAGLSNPNRVGTGDARGLVLMRERIETGPGEGCERNPVQRAFNLFLDEKTAEQRLNGGYAFRRDPGATRAKPERQLDVPDTSHCGEPRVLGIWPRGLTGNDGRNVGSNERGEDAGAQTNHSKPDS